MKIEVGKEYRSRDGERWQCIGPVDAGMRAAGFAYLCKNEGGYVSEFTSDGYWCLPKRQFDTCHDLIVEWTEPAQIKHMLEGSGSAPAQKIVSNYSDELSDETLDRLAKISAGLEFEPADEHENLRDRFAMAALTGMCSGDNLVKLKLAGAEVAETAALSAYLIATAMMEARKKP